jgi:homoserine dehydrogenase
MTQNHCSFADALKEAQGKGFAESNPTLDINGMDSVHKLAILVYLAFGKFVPIKDIYREGITHISHDDIEYATSLNLTIKLLAIAKKEDKKIEARVHPTLISKDHPLASINSIYNAIYMNTDPLGSSLLSGEGAGQMAAASGVVSDLINFAARGNNAGLPSNLYSEAAGVKLRKIDQIKTKFYIRFMVTDKPGVLSAITGVLGKHNISINSVTQKAHNPTSTVPIIMLTDYATEKMLRLALNKIYKFPFVQSKPVAIRMEKLW